MKVKIDKSFQRDVKKIDDKKLRSKIAVCIESLLTSKTITEIQNIRKLKVPGNYYRIRLGQYRLGVVINGDEIVLIRFLHRKDVYRYFPK